MFEICAVTHVGLYIKCPLFMSGVYQNWNALTDLSKISAVSKFREKRFRGSRVS
jgi:hypothetical protein